ncbi:MAG: hypothetical protein AB1649_32185, partial [Chloroflexota bacterium]
MEAVSKVTKQVESQHKCPLTLPSPGGRGGCCSAGILPVVPNPRPLGEGSALVPRLQPGNACRPGSSPDILGYVPHSVL